MRALRVVTVLALLVLALAPPASAQGLMDQLEQPLPGDGAAEPMEATEDTFVLTVRLENRGESALILDAAADVAEAAARHERFHQDRCWVSTTLAPGEANEFTCLLPWGEGPYLLHGAAWTHPNATAAAANYSQEFFAPNRSVVMAVAATGDGEGDGGANATGNATAAGGGDVRIVARPASEKAVGAFPEDAAVLALELRNDQSGAVAMVASSDNVNVEPTVANPATCVATTTLNASETSRFRCPLAIEMGHYFLQTAAGPVATGNVTMSNQTLFRPTGQVAPFTLQVTDDAIHIR